MCLITKQKKPIILKEDITVYKKLVHVNNFLKAFHHNFTYKLGKLYATKITNSQIGKYADEFAIDLYGRYETKNEWTKMMGVVKFSNEVTVYNEGFHFYTTKERISASESSLLVECTIPAGSEVYYDEKDLGVTNQIIINQVIS